MRGTVYYAIVDTVKLYSTAAMSTPVATIKKKDEAGVSTGVVITTNGDRFIELIRLSDSKTLYALEKEVSMNPDYAGNTLPEVTVTAKKTPTTVGERIQAQIKKNPALAYSSLGVLLIGIGTVLAKWK